jgi:hypothetical protein
MKPPLASVTTGGDSSTTLASKRCTRISAVGTPSARWAQVWPCSALQNAMK